MARWFGLTDIAEAAASAEPGAWADDVAVVTGASDGSSARCFIFIIEKRVLFPINTCHRFSARCFIIFIIEKRGGVYNLT
jgi:hypothetical protein